MKKKQYFCSEFETLQTEATRLHISREQQELMRHAFSAGLGGL